MQGDCEYLFDMEYIGRYANLQKAESYNLYYKERWRKKKDRCVLYGYRKIKKLRRRKFV